jgi:hypothetical protein
MVSGMSRGAGFDDLTTIQFWPVSHSAGVESILVPKCRIFSVRINPTVEFGVIAELSFSVGEPITELKCIGPLTEKTTGLPR